MLYSALLLGLVSSLHCIGMCGPIALMLPVARNHPEKKALQILSYHAGRILAYTAIGLLFALVGRAFYLAGFQQHLSLFAGFAMIAIAIVPEKRLARYNFSRPIFKIISEIKSALGRQFRNSSFTSLFTIGLLNGFLPCGMVYAAVFGALAMPTTGLAVSYMVLFGLGTAPLMSTVVYFQRLITLPVRNSIQKIIPYAMVCIGILFILRGLGLDVAYLSPSNLNLLVQSEPNCH
ncbi:sulfite exporter TauE/SafE family protein [Flavobacterium sp.]|uniref:sulfite exporter TauE/SafE family protein n=1 Tax=Flavobacterium sp. TaxID=239 RepID=UPI0039E657C4